MFTNFTRSFLLACLLLLANTVARANDSDVVNCGKPFTIVLLGSSSTFGQGASTYDSSWAGKFTAYVHRKNSQTVVYNFGIPSYTTYHVLCPTGLVPPAGRPAPDASNNITAALALHPDAIIINLPTNDAANDYSLKEQQTNYERAIFLANQANVPVWVTTTQPRNNLTAAQMSLLTQMRDWTNTRFGAKAIDFWTTLANGDGTINNTYNVDGTHVNNKGHEIFYRRVQAETILDSLCLRNMNTLNARAGNDTSIILPASGFVLNGTGSFGPNPITGYNWTKISGPAITGIATPGSAITSLTNLAEGTYTFQLTVTDNTAATNSDQVTVIVGSRILIDFGPASTTTPDVTGKFWNNVSVTQTGIQLTSAVATSGAVSNISLNVVNRIDGTFNIDGPGTNTGNTIGNVGDYPESATTDFAFASPTTTDGKWTFNGLEASKQYTFKFWGTRSVDDDRIIQIKRTDAAVWQEYNAAGNTDYLNAASFTFYGKSSISFDIRTKDGSAFGYISVVDISRTVAVDAPNLPPTARAGNNISVSAPNTTATLNGSTSSDEDGDIVSYHWNKLTGAAAAVITTPNTANSTLTGLAEGKYTFELVVTDNDGAIGRDTVAVNVGTRILFDFGLTATPAPDADGKYWNNVANAQTGAIIANAITTGNTASSVSLQVVNRIDGTFNVDGPGTSTGNTASDVGDYPNSATTDYAFAEPSTTTGSWKLTGLDATKEYSVKFWGTRSVGDDRIIQIKTTDQSAWLEYNAANNTNYDNAASFTFIGKTEQSFDIRTKDGSPFGYISVVDINVTTPPPCVPVTPSVTITATPGVSVCQGSNITFSATAVNGGTVPVWSWTKNGAVIAGAATSTFNSNTLVSGDVINCVLTSNVACASVPSATSNSLVINIKVPTSSTTSIAACNSYTWNTVNYTSSGTYIKTGLVNKAGCDSTATLVLTINRIATQPIVITGPVNACPYVATTANPNVAATYIINKVANATSYNWTVPANAAIITRPGIAGTANDTIITVRYTSAFVSGNISVSATNSCGTSAARALTITKSIAAAPGIITGVTNACANITTNTVATYTISKIADAADYDWTISGTGASIVSHPAGEGLNDTIITVRYTTAFTSGTISVKTVSNCGTNATARTLAITKAAPATPTITGNMSACSGGTYVYTANTSGATSYTWTVPSGCTIVGAATGASISVKYPTFFLLGIVSVKATSPCGTSATNSFIVVNCLLGLNFQVTYKTTAQPAAEMNNTPPKGQSTVSTTVTVTDKSGTAKNASPKTAPVVDTKAAINVFPNPSDGNFTIAVKGNIKAAPVTIEVLNNYGQAIYKTTSTDPSIQVRIASKLTSGVYFVRSNVNGQIITQKLVVNR